MNMKELLKNPMTIWLSWYINSRKVLLKNKNKHLKIGYLTDLLNVEIGNYNTFYDNVKITNSKVDDYVYVSPETIIMFSEIGKFCSIGPRVRIGMPMHPTHYISTFPIFYSAGKQCQFTFAEKNYFVEHGSVKIGNDVWIGANAIVMSNVTIGDGAIIAAGAIVTKDVEPYSIVGGIPARLIRHRFEEHEIEKLLKAKWWDRDIEWIKANYLLFQNSKEMFEFID